MATKAVAVKAKREEGTRAVAFLIDNGTEFTLPEDAIVLADSMIDLDNPDPNQKFIATDGKEGSYKVLYVPMSSPDSAISVTARVAGEVLEDVKLGGQFTLYLTAKAVNAAIAKARSKR